MYMPEIAHKKYLEIKSNSNKTLKDLSKYKFLDKIQKRLDKGQTLVHIVYSLKEKYDDMVSLTTLYNWIKEEKNF